MVALLHKSTLTRDKLAGLAGAVWIIVMVASLGWNWHQIGHSMMVLAESESRASFEKDLVFRRWAAMHGGVYVPPTDRTPPNPFLSYHPERDVVTTTGKNLTLINPAYLTRQVHELGRAQYGLQGHITSLRPIRPENAPDVWEAAALRSFETGVTKVTSVEKIDGAAYFRLMRPLVTEAGCLGCHRTQGYKEGDIRGGISISVPLAPYAAAAGRQRLWLALAHALIMGLGLLALWGGNGVLRGSEKVLSERERYYAALIHNLHEDILVIDRNYRITDVNNMVLKTIGKTRREIIGERCHMAFYGLNAPCEAQDAPCPLRHVFDTGESLNCRHKHVKLDGTIIHVDILASPVTDLEGNVTHIIEAVRDISDLFAIQEALRESEERFHALMEQASDGFFLHDAGKILEVNRAACEMTGYSREELLCLCIRDVDPKVKRDRHKEAIREKLAAGKTFTIASELKRKDGTLLPVEINLGQVEFREKKLMLGLVRDITERKKLQTRLHQAEKMEAIGQLAGGVAHDFNNMLGIIIGRTELVQNQVDPAQPLFANLQEIRNAAERSADLTRQLLAFARKQTISPRVISLNAAVENALRMLHRLIGEDITLSWKPGGQVWPVKMDPSQVDQILANLCVNARDAIAGVGKITIETGNISFDDGYCGKHPGFVPGDYAVLTLSDNGCGMDRETLGKIFEPFFTTKALGKGTGLGLATIYGIVKQNSGFINVYSEAQHGTTFNIYLPMHVSNTQPMQTEKQPVPVRCGSETILLVEDEPTVLTVVKEMLGRLGYRVMTAASPGEAIALAEASREEEIHLLMTDIIMPEMNGRELAKRIGSLCPSVRALFMSGYPEDVIASHGILDEDVSFIQKPFSRQKLADKVREVLDSR